MEFAGLDRISRSEQPRHHIVSARGARDRSFLRQLARDGAEGCPLLDDDIVRPRLRPSRPPEQINGRERGGDQDCRRDQEGALHTAFMIRLALVPPKPKLLLSAARTGRFFALCGTRSTPSVPSSGLSRLSVGGTI